MSISDYNSKEKTTSMQEATLEELLIRRSSFKFQLCFDHKKFQRNNVLLVFFNMIFGASLGALLSFLLDLLGFTNEYAILGICAGIGAGF
ncbi:MAG: hypothetical protein FK734_21285, partial [Asgard group archaeon]|nr:hypothetical protein [Asgard group archaeon]